MNITILTNRDLASCFALNRLIPGLAEHQVTVFLSSRVGSKPLAVPLQHLKFVEQDLLNGLIAPLLDSGASGRAREGQALFSFEQLAEREQTTDLEGFLRRESVFNSETVINDAADDSKF